MYVCTYVCMLYYVNMYTVCAHAYLYFFKKFYYLHDLKMSACANSFLSTLSTSNA